MASVALLRVMRPYPSATTSLPRVIRILTVPLRPLPPLRVITHRTCLESGRVLGGLESLPAGAWPIENAALADPMQATAPIVRQAKPAANARPWNRWLTRSSSYLLHSPLLSGGPLMQPPPGRVPLAPARSV